MAKSVNKFVSVETVEALRKELQSLKNTPAPKPDRVSKLELVNRMKDEINILLANGYKLSHIVDILKAKGVHISLSTLKSGLQGKVGAKLDVKNKDRATSTSGANSGSKRGTSGRALEATQQDKQWTEPRSGFRVRPDSAEL